MACPEFGSIHETISSFPIRLIVFDPFLTLQKLRKPICDVELNIEGQVCNVWDRSQDAMVKSMDLASAVHQFLVGVSSEEMAECVEN